MEFKARNLDRELHQDPEGDRFISSSELVQDNELEMIAVSKRSVSLLPQYEPLAKI